MLKKSSSALLVAALFAAGCGGGSSSGGGGGVVGFRAVAVGQNNVSGTVQLFDINGNAIGTVTPGGNENIQMAGNTLIQADDSVTPSELVLFQGPVNQRFSSNSTFNSMTDARTTLANNGNAKGILFVPSRNVVLVTQFNGRGSAGQVDVYSLAGMRGTTGTPQGPIASLAPYSGTNIAAGSPVTATSPWDLLYDAGTDRLFVVLTDGFVAVYDSFFNTTLSGQVADRFFRPTGAGGVSPSINNHGVGLMNGRLVISDVGDAAVSTDGQIFIMNTSVVTSGTGDVDAAAVIAGSSTMLGNPVDLLVDGTSVYIAEKSNAALLRFDGVDALTGNNNIAPNLSVAITAPESVFLLTTDVVRTVNHNDVEEGSNTITTLSGFVVVQNPAGAADAAEGDLVFVNSDLSATTSTLDSGGISFENASFDETGTLYVTGSAAGDGSEGAGTGSITTIGGFFGLMRPVSSGALTGTVDDGNRITGALTGLNNPKGIEVDGTRGVMLVTDVATATVSLFAANASGNVAPLATITNLGMSGTVNAWDLDYDATNDRLFTANTNGTISVFDNAVSRLMSGNITAAPDRFITPMISVGGTMQAAVNNHGIEYVPATDTLILTDVGSAASATDGILYGITGASTANGTVGASFNYNGAATMLGNPVDLVVIQNDAFVAEKSNNAILQFSLNVTGEQNTAPFDSIGVNAPESIIPRFNAVPLR